MLDFKAMGEFLGIMLSIIFYLTPKEVESVQIWPNATDTNSKTKELSLIFHRSASGWYPDGISTNMSPGIRITDGKWVDEQGKTLLEIKKNLKVTNGTNYVFKPKDFENPLEFSVAGSKEDRAFSIKSNGKVIRAFRVKVLKSNKGAAANRRPVGQSDGSRNLSATFAADRAFPAAVAELGR
jgi:hypothetical protein